MNEWIYRDSMTEYQERLNAAEKERRALKLTAGQSLNQIISAVIAGLPWQQKPSRARLQRNR